MAQIITILLITLSCNLTFASDDQSYLHYMKAEEMMMSGDALGALDEYKIAYSHDMDSAELKAKIAYTYLGIGEQEKAEKEIADALKLGSNSLTALNVSLEILLAQKNYTKALKTCDEILKQSPNDKEVINYKVALMIETGQNKEALEFIKKYSKNNPSDEFPYYYLGLLAGEKGNLIEAEKNFITAISLNPDHEPTVVTLILLYEKQYSGEKLLKKLEKLSASIGETNDDLNNRIIMLNVDLGGKEHLNKAITYLNQSYGTHPLPYIAIEKASIYDRLGEKDAAIKELREAIVNYQKNDSLLLSLAILYDNYGKKEEALGVMEKIYEIDPNNPEVLNYIGYSYANKGVKMEKARALLLKAAELSPDDPYVIDSLVWLNYKEGNFNDAKSNINKTMGLIQKKSLFEEEIIGHIMTIYKATNDVDGQKKMKTFLTDMLNSKKHSDKKDSIRKFLELIDEKPQRSPASIKR